MNTIDKYAAQCDLAWAVYADLQIGGIQSAQLSDPNTSAIPEPFAANLADRYRVVDILDSFTGAYAVIFEENTTGARTLAIRGTSDASDYVADYLITQVPPSFNPQYLALKAKVSEWQDAGVIDASTAVTGHSLGGYLAAALKSQFASMLGATFTYNSPGVGSGLGTITEFFQNTFGIAALAADIQDVRGTQGLSFLGGLGQHWGAPVAVEIEAAAGVGLGNHSIDRINQSLAVLRMLARLDPSLPLDRGNQFLQAASVRAEDTLEKLLNAAYGFFSDGSTATKTGDDQALYERLIALQANFGFRALEGKTTVTLATASNLATRARTDFGAFLALQALSPIVLGTDTSGQAILKQANETLAKQWEGDQALTLEQRDAGLLTFSDTYLFDRQALLQYQIVANIKDAIANPDGYLAVQGGRSTEANLRFVDMASGTRLQANTTRSSPSTAPNQYVLFGDGATNTLSGLEQDDRIYGGGGNDTINGLDGDDYIEGGTGDDSVDGGKDMDTLLGGAGDDTLAGGEGHDLLLGGTGNDTYQFTGSFGLDIVRDGDGLGRITVDGRPELGDGNNLAEDVWESGDKAYAYTFVGGNLVIVRRSADGASPGGILTVQGWKPRNLGITLSETPVPATATTSSYIGDFVKRRNADGTQYVLGADGQYVADGDLAGAADLLTGTTGADLIVGLGGDDALAGNDGDDVLEGGDGNDVIMGGRGADILSGGGGRDLIYGSSTGSLQYPTSTSYQLVETAYPVLLGEGFNWRLSSPGLDDDGYQHGFLSNTVSRDTQPADQGNVIDGGTGDDIIYAGTGSDVVHAGGDSDQTMGMAGDDVLFGDEGDDRIYGDGPSSNADALVYTPSERHGRDVLVGGTGEDLLIGQGNDDALYGGDDNDILYGDDRDASNTPLSARGHDYLDGGSGNDTLFGNEGDDILIGGAGDDVLNGGAGRDTYIINRGEGRDVIVDTKSENNIIRFGAGVASADVTLRLGSLMLDLGNGDEVHIEGFNPDDALNSSAIDSFEFADGAVLGTGELLARGFDVDGSAGNDDLRGTSVTDRIRGFGGEDKLSGGGGEDSLDGGSGDDVLSGQAGNDLLKGDAGNDVLAGGTGDDVYVFNVGDGHDLLSDASGSDTVVFGEGISVHSITVRLMGALLELAYGEGDSITSESTASSYRFADGTVITGEQMRARIELSGSQASLRVTGTVAADALEGGAGDDVVFGNDGDDLLKGGAGDDALFGDAGNDTVQGGVGVDALVGGAGNDSIHGNEGSDRLWGQAGDDSLYGGDGDDELNGGDGNDVLAGGRGDDLLMAGGTGAKTYIFEADGGDDIVTAFNGTRHIQFGTGILPASIKLFPSPAIASTPYVRVQYSGQDSVLIQLGTGTGPLDYRFADGTVLTHSSLAAMATQATKAPYVVVGTVDDDLLRANGTSAQLEGLGGADQLIGSGFNDVLHGGGGADTLYGGDGNDVLAGGQGKDSLHGGAGSDSYVYTRGDGSDVITEDGNSAEVNVLRFTDLTAGDVAFTREASGSLLVHVKDSADTIEIQNWYGGSPTRIQQIAYADGSIVDTAVFNDLEQSRMMVPTYGGQLVGTPYSDMIVGSGGDDAIDGGAGDDTITGGFGADTYLMRWGMGLDTILESPGDSNVLKLDQGLTFAHLVFEQQASDLYVRLTGSLSGVLLKNYYAGLDSWRVVDQEGAQKTLATLIEETRTRISPVTVEGLREQWVSNAKTSYIRYFMDPELGGNPSNTVSFDDRTQTSDALDIDRLSQPSDDSYAPRYEWFTVQVPETRYDLTETAQGQVVITDLRDLGVDGQPKDYSFDPNVGVRIEWIGNFNVGQSSVPTRTVQVKVAVSTMAQYNVIVEGINAGDSANRIGIEWLGAVDGAGGDDVIFANRAFGGDDDPGVFLDGGAGNDFLIGGEGRDFVIGGEGDDYLAGSQGGDTYYLLANQAGAKTIDEAALFWSVAGLGHGEMTTWSNAGYQDSDRDWQYPGYAMNQDTIEFGAGIALDQLMVRRGHYVSPYAHDFGYPNWPYDRTRVPVYYWDESLPDTRQFETLDFTWEQGRTARVLLTQNTDDSYENDGTGIELFRFHDGTVLTLDEMQSMVDSRSGHTVSLWTGDGDQNIMMTPDISAVRFGPGILASAVTVTREGSSAVLSAGVDRLLLDGWFEIFDPADPTSFSVQFADGTTWDASFFHGSNHLPSVSQALGDQAASEDSPWTFTLPAGTFIDEDADDVLTYSATLASGEALPVWLRFDAESRTFSGTPANENVGSLDLNVTVTDAAGTSASATFALAVVNVNDAPTAAKAIGDQVAAEDQPWTLAVEAGTFVDVDAGEVLHFEAALADGRALPSWISFDAASRTFSGTPANADVGNMEIKVTAVDAAGKSASSAFELLVANVNDAPIAVGPLPGWSAVAGEAAAYAVPSGAFADEDAGDVLSLSATVIGGAPLPSWLGFDSHTGVFSGTPINMDGEDIVLIVTAMDLSGVRASQSINLHVERERDHILNGTTGADTLIGGAGNDSLDGGLGADIMRGGKGDDSYFVDTSGDLVAELPNQGMDTVYAWVSYALPANVDKLVLVGDGLGVPATGLPAGVTLPTLPDTASASGTSGTGNDAANVLIGNARGNVLTGRAGDDTLDGGAGDDRLVGGIGNDRYILGRGYGKDTIAENDGSPDNTDVALFADGIGYDQIWFRKQGKNLEVSVIGTSDLFSIEDWFKGSRYHVEQFSTGDGKVLLDSQVQNLVDAMAGFSPPPAGETNLAPDYQRALGSVLAANWQ